MKAWLKNWWRLITTSTELALVKAENRRLRESNLALEDELENSRAELRAAVNNLLSQAGVAPLPPHEEIKPPANRMRRLTLGQRQRLYAIATTPAEPKDGTNVR
jgi:hypothetical protein